MKINTYQCNYCTEIKGFGNHWFMRDMVSDQAGSFAIISWDEGRADDLRSDSKPEFEHICGNVCAGKALEKWLGQQTSQSA